MELNTATLSDFVKLADVLWLQGLSATQPVMKESGLFKMVDIPANSGNTREFSEIDPELYASTKDQGDQAERAQVQQGYTKTMTQKRIAKDIGITYEMRTQNKYPEVVARLTSLGSLAANRMELDLAHQITFCTDTSYTDQDGNTITTTVGDGFQLAYTAHELRGSATTYRNRLANNPRLSKGALEGMERLIDEETYNQFGQKVATMPFDILWTTAEPNTVNTAREYLQATADPDATHTGVPNVYRSKYRHAVLPLVATTAAGANDTTKRYYWGLASSMGSSAYLGIWEAPRLKTPSDLNAGEEFSTDDWNFGVRAGYGIVIVGATWFKFSSGDGTA